MRTRPLAITSTGLVTAVGQSAARACAAIRAKLTNPEETHFTDSAGDRIIGHTVTFERPLRGLEKLARMASMAASECLARVPAERWLSIPLLLCVAEEAREGRTQGLDAQLFYALEENLRGRFAPESALIPQGRASIGSALYKARELLYEGNAPAVLIVGADSLITGPQLSAFGAKRRLLTPRNSNGFIPGEAAGALLISRPNGEPQLLCTGLGFGHEAATLEAELPLRAQGLTDAIKGALAEAERAFHDLDFRIADLSGEQYFFKETSLVLSRVLRKRMEEFDLWHAAECTGEVGAATGPTAFTVIDTACRKAYAPGGRVLFHASNDGVERTAAVLEYGVV